MEPTTARRLNEVQASEVPDLQSIVLHSGLCADTLILTLDGELPAKDIAVGDRVITRDIGAASVTSVRHDRVTLDAIQIKAGSFGHMRPTEDTILPATSRLLIRDWRSEALFGKSQTLVDARKLQDGEFVKVLPNHTMDVVEIFFERPFIIYAGGLEMACLGKPRVVS